MSPPATPRVPLRSWNGAPDLAPRAMSARPRTQHVPSIANLLLPAAELPDKSLLSLSALADAAERAPHRARSSPVLPGVAKSSLARRSSRSSLRNSARGAALSAAATVAASSAAASAGTAPPPTDSSPGVAPAAGHTPAAEREPHSSAHSSAAQPQHPHHPDHHLHHLHHAPSAHRLPVAPSIAQQHAHDRPHSHSHPPHTSHAGPQPQSQSHTRSPESHRDPGGYHASGPTSASGGGSPRAQSCNSITHSIQRSATQSQSQTASHPRSPPSNTPRSARPSSSMYASAAASVRRAHAAAAVMDVEIPPPYYSQDMLDPGPDMPDTPGTPGVPGSSGRPRTTPDAKRAQNRESAKRFRVAQKKRWAELLETVAEKDAEIEKLKRMLQEVTESRLPTQRRSSSGSVTAPPADMPADSLVLAELDLVVKLMSAPAGDHSRPSPASNTGHLHRILVATTDGVVTGVRHQQPHVGGCVADGGRVGQSLWDGVPESDQLQLRFTVLHATRMAPEMAAEPCVFAYRRHINLPNAPSSSLVRIKGCVHPLMDDSGRVTTLLLAEFIET